MTLILDSTYIGPVARFREDRAFQLGRARRDLELAQAMARREGNTHAAISNRRIAAASIPAIMARIAKWGA